LKIDYTYYENNPAEWTQERGEDEYWAEIPQDLMWQKNARNCQSNGEMRGKIQLLDDFSEKST
jgi:hypothetical protein